MKQALPVDDNHDKEQTVAHLTILEQNDCLMEWYKNLWDHICENHQISPSNMRILEIGSGASPLKKFAPNILTTDILNLPWLDFIIDAHKIDELKSKDIEPFDAIVMTHVLHHLNNPIEFLQKAATMLKPGGKIVMAEPFFSVWGNFVYRFLHHEPVDMKITEPLLPKNLGPLSDSNQALPFLLFFKKESWRGLLSQQYDLSATQINYFASFTYALSGGFSKKPFVSLRLFKKFIKLDRVLAKKLPRGFAFTFTCALVRK